MLLVLAFVCFFVLFAAWLMVPNAEEKTVLKSAPESAPTGAGNLQTQV